MTILTTPALPATPTFTLRWGSYGTAPGQFYSPSAIAIAPDGNIWVCDRGNNRIQQFTPSGTFVSMWGSFGSEPGRLYSPNGIAIDAAGYVYVCDINARVQKFTPDGTFLKEWYTFTPPPDHRLANTHRVAAEGADYIFVTLESGHVARYDTSGALSCEWGGSGYQEGKFAPPGPMDVGVAPDGSVYVADEWGQRVQKFFSWCTYAASWGVQLDPTFARPRGLAVDAGGRVYVSNFTEMRSYSDTGVLLSQWGTYGHADGQFIEIEDVAVDGTGAIYVVDSIQHSIQKFVDATTPSRATTWGRLKLRYR